MSTLLVKVLRRNFESKTAKFLINRIYRRLIKYAAYLIISCQRSGFLWNVCLLYSLLFLQLMESNAHDASGYNHFVRRFSLSYIRGYVTVSRLRGLLCYKDVSLNMEQRIRYNEGVFSNYEHKIFTSNLLKKISKHL